MVLLGLHLAHNLLLLLLCQPLLLVLLAINKPLQVILHSLIVHIILVGEALHHVLRENCQKSILELDLCEIVDLIYESMMRLVKSSLGLRMVFKETMDQSKGVLVGQLVLLDSLLRG